MTDRSKLRDTSGGAKAPPDNAILDYDEYGAIPSRRMEITISLVALALSILAIVLSRSIDLRMGGGGIDAKWWPTVLSSGAAVLSGFMLVSALALPLADREDLEGAQKDGWGRMFIALALSALYVFAWWRFGYIVPTLVYLVALLFTFGVRSWLALILYPVLTTAFIYGLFHFLLRVPL